MPLPWQELAAQVVAATLNAPDGSRLENTTSAWTMPRLPSMWPGVSAVDGLVWQNVQSHAACIAVAPSCDAG